jgi:hypothetical protein
MRLTSVAAGTLMLLFSARVAHADSAEREATAHYRAASRAFEDGDTVAAVDELKKSIAARPTVKAYLLLGNADIKLGQLDDARQAFEKVIELDPKSSKRKTVENYVHELDLLSRTKLIVTSDPPGATVYIDLKADGPKGKTPAAVPVVPGRHRVMLELDGYEPFTAADVTAIEGKDVPLQAALKMKGCDVAIASEPSGASAVIDTEPPAVTPLRRRVKLGAHAVVLSLAGRANIERSFTCEDGKDVAMAESFAPAPAMAHLAVSAPAGGEVAVDGRKLGGAAPVEVPPGKHEIEVSAPGASTWSAQVVMPTEGERIELRASPPALPAPTPTAPPARPRFYERWWFGTTIGVVAGAALGIGLGFGLSSSTNPTSHFGSQTVF